MIRKKFFLFLCTLTIVTFGLLCVGQGQGSLQNPSGYLPFLNVALGTITADLQAITNSVTWNNAGTTFTLNKYVVTDSNSAASSKFFEYFSGASGTTSVASLDKSGFLTLGGGITSNSGSWRLINGSFIAFGSASGEGITGNQSTNTVALRTSATNQLAINSVGQVSLTAGLLQGTGVGVITFVNSGSTGVTFQTNSLPTISSGFGSSPSITAGATATLGDINVGTGGAATSGVINFNNAWTNAPYCFADDATTDGKFTRAATTTTQLTLSTSVAWAASDHLRWWCVSVK